jgi:uncharacterized protein
MVGMQKGADISHPKSHGLYFLWISAAIVIVFALQSFAGGTTDAFALSSNMVIIHPWTIVTFIFLHAGMSHLISNLTMLLLFGFIFERVSGSRNFLLVFFASGAISGIAGIPLYQSMIGASGAIFGLIGALSVIRPRMVVPAFGIPIPIVAAAAIWLLLDIGGVFYPSSVANIGHMAGLAFGIAYGFSLKRTYGLPPARKRERIVLDEDYFRWWEETYVRKPKNVWRKMRRDRARGSAR